MAMGTSRAKLAKAIHHTRRRGRDRFVVQMTLYVVYQPQGCAVAAVSVLLQALHHDPVQVAAADRPVSLTGLGIPRGRRSMPADHPNRSAFVLGLRRLYLSDNPLHLVAAAIPAGLSVKGRVPGEQLVQQHAQANKCHSAYRRRGSFIAACSGLMYTGVPIIWSKRV